MPVIPSITGSRPLPNLPGPVLDRERRPTIDNRNLISAVGRLGASTKQPEVPMSLAAPSEGLAQVGQAVAKAGAILSQVAIEEQEATTKIQIHRADSQLQSKVDEFEAWRANNPDPLTWRAKWDETIKPVQQTLLADKNLTPRAREIISLRADTTLRQQSGAVEVATQKAIFAEAKKADLGELQNAINAQDPERYKAARASKYFYDHEREAFDREYKLEGERLEKKARADAIDQAANQVTTLADGMGEGAALSFIDRLKMPDADKEQLRGEARRISRTRTADFADQVANGILAGEITNPARIDELTAGNPHVDEQTRAKLKAFLAQKDENAIHADREKDGVRNAVGLRQKAKDYDPKTDKTGEKYLSLRWEVHQRVPEGLRNGVLDILEAKAAGKTVPIPPGIKGHVDATLDRIFDPVHGAIKWRSKQIKEVWEPETNSDGTIKTDKDSQPKMRKVTRNVDFDDQTKQQQAIDARAALERELAPWLQANPNASPKEVSDKIGELLPAGTRKQAAEALKGTASTGKPLGTVTSYGYANDETPDRNSSAGIGAFVPDEEQKKIKSGMPSEFRLRENDIAVSQDIEQEFRKAGVEPGDQVMVKLANGESRLVRWMDRTANDEQLVSINAARAKKGQKPIAPLRGRFDFYSPRGRSDLDGVKVVGWSKPESLLAGS